VASYQGDLVSKLVQHANSLNGAERMGLLHDLTAVADAGHFKISDALIAAQPFANAPERQVSGQVRSLVAGVRNTLPPALLPNYARYVRKLFAARAAELGWAAKPGEDGETRLLRTSLVPFVARRGDDAAFQAEARRLAQGWLKDRQGVDADMLPAVLSTAARSGGQDLFEGMLRAFKETQDPRQRQVILGGLAAFQGPKILGQALALLTDPNLDARDSFGLVFAASGDPQTAKVTFEFLKANYDAVVKRLPSAAGTDYRAFLPFVGAGFCDDPSRQEFVTFFQDRVKDYVGGPRNYAEALESIRLCQAHRAAQAGDVAEFFSRQ
jgi:aminopeptidase N